MTVGPLSPIPLSARSPQSDPAHRRTAQALEGAFLAEMLKAAGLAQTRSTLGGGEGEEQFASFLADAQARLLVQRGGIGLTPLIERMLDQRDRSTP